MSKMTELVTWIKPKYNCKTYRMYPSDFSLLSFLFSLIFQMFDLWKWSLRKRDAIFKKTNKNNKNVPQIMLLHLASFKYDTKFFSNFEEIHNFYFFLFFTNDENNSHISLMICFSNYSYNPSENTLEKYLWGITIYVKLGLNSTTK